MMKINLIISSPNVIFLLLSEITHQVKQALQTNTLYSKSLAEKEQFAPYPGQYWNLKAWASSRFLLPE